MYIRSKFGTIYSVWAIYFLRNLRANSIDEDGVKIGEDIWPERHIYLIGNVNDIIPFDRDVIVRPYFN